ncbi:MAG: LLM class flavin-dependent oxidoreductase [Acidimicrobiales bacterium]
MTQEAERLGFDSVWTAEAWGSDAFTPLGWIAGHTSTIKLGTSVVQLAAAHRRRPPWRPSPSTTSPTAGSSSASA